MALSIKAKLSAGIGVLFALLLTVSVVAFAFINIVSKQTGNILKDNYVSVQYCNEMLSALNRLKDDPQALKTFEQNLQKEEDNVTELGEGASTQKLRYHFEQVKAGNATRANIDSINHQLYVLTMLNQKAIERKNDRAIKASHNATLWISILTAVFVLVGFTLAINIPQSIAGPLRELTDGIREIANKNYRKRIYIENKDELGEMAAAFNKMGEKLNEYESSNLSKLMFEKQRVETIINQMEDAVLGLDADHKVLFINSEAAKLFNLKPADIIGQYAPDVALYNDLFRTVLQKDPQHKALKIVVDGKENYFAVDARTVLNEDKQIGEVFTLKNITSFKELDISKTNLLATISHELKTPISSIKMSTKLINDNRVGPLNEEQQELIQHITDDANRLLKLTGELLNMTQLETGNIQLKLQQTSAATIVDASLPVVNTQANQKNIKIKLDYEKDLPDIFADADKTSWVLVNLLSNAIKFSPSGSNVVVKLKKAGKMVQFSVQDFGQGIEERHASRIFDRYYKIPGETAGIGTGLGLSISKEFIEAQGGWIRLESNPGMGSIFSFQLPIANKSVKE